MTEAMPFLQKTILLSYDPRPFGGEIFFWSRPGSRSLSPAGEIPAGAPKNLLVCERGDFFLVAPGESKSIPDRGNPRWSTKQKRKKPCNLNGYKVFCILWGSAQCSILQHVLGAI